MKLLNLTTVCGVCYKEILNMPTQIASTPIIKGLEAVKIWKEANKKPSKDVELGVEKLKALFEPKIKK